MNISYSFKNIYNDLYRLEQLKALRSAFFKDNVFFYRKVCRWYSTTFHTPLMEVYKLSFNHIIQNYYESQMEELDNNQLFDLATKEMLPEFIKKSDDYDEAFARSLEEEQAQTLKNKEKHKKKAEDGPETELPTKAPEIPEVDLDFEGLDDGMD